MEGYPTINALRQGEIIDIDGIRLKMAGETGDEIRPGDLYVAERNRPAQLLTAKSIDNGCIRPTCGAYSFDLHECVKVEEA